MRGCVPCVVVAACSRADVRAPTSLLCRSPLLEVSEKHPENADRVRNMRSVCLKGPIGASVTGSTRDRRAAPHSAAARAAAANGPHARTTAAPHLDWHAPHEATVAELASTHDVAYLESLRAASVSGKRFGASTVLPPGGWLPISLAAGAALDAADAVLLNAARLAFCLVRPPGHHASRASNDGYCQCVPLLRMSQLAHVLTYVRYPCCLIHSVNNAAVAANRAAAAGHRVAILDFDVHRACSRYGYRGLFAC